jgi:hypothetical protein
LINVARGTDGDLAADVEYSDGRRQRFVVRRNANGDLEGEFEDGAAPDDVAAPAVEAEPGPKGFGDVFGSVDGGVDDR